MKKYLTRYTTIIAIAIIVLVIDLVFKHFFCFEETKEIIPHLINFHTNYGNSGVAFGMLSGNKWLLIIMALAFLCIFFAFDIWQKPKSKLYIIGFSFIVGGALGNLVDRIRLGYVRDFINFTFWESFPTFNMADCFLCIGVALVCIYLVFISTSKKNDKNNK